MALISNWLHSLRPTYRPISNKTRIETEYTAPIRLLNISYRPISNKTRIETGLWPMPRGSSPILTDQSPTKQGLKPNAVQGLTQRLAPYRPISNKTRIETASRSGFAWILPPLTDQSPTKQGLKQALLVPNLLNFAGLQTNLQQNKD